MTEWLDQWKHSLILREVIGETVEEWDLGGENFLFRDVEGEPCGAVDFRNLDFAPGAWRPLDFGGHAEQACGVEVAFESPCGDDFAAELLNVAEGAVLA